jgi:hypothetical protein
MFLRFIFYKLFNLSTIKIAVFNPSSAALVIPPAYPAPSPIGYIPLIFDS